MWYHLEQTAHYRVKKVSTPSKMGWVLFCTRKNLNKMTLPIGLPDKPEFYLFFLFFRPAYIPIAITKTTATTTPYSIRVSSFQISICRIHYIKNVELPAADTIGEIAGEGHINMKGK